MKKIIISEKSLKKNKNILKENVADDLTSFILDKVNQHQTSLSNCDVFPNYGITSYEYIILKDRFNKVKDNILQYNDIEKLDEDYLISYLSNLITKAQQLEEPIKPKLTKCCENILIKLFDIPSETVNISCKLVNKIIPKEGAIRMLPEDDDNVEYDFSNLTSFGAITKSVMKRRLINALIQGASYELGTIFDLYDIDNEELIDIYKRIIAINDFILFTVKEKISDKNPNQGAYVEVLLGRKGEKTDINVQGIVFPLLVIEAVRGFFELFASHGLPKDNELAKKVISHSDFLFAEPWDLRLGVPLWEKLTSKIDNTKILPFYFTNICKMHNQEFHDTMKTIFSDDVEGKKKNGMLINVAENQYDYQKFTDTMALKNADFNVITDDITNPEDLDQIELKEDYRELSIPFDGNVWKYNYEYFLDYLEKIGKKGTLPPDKWTQQHGLSINCEIAWEYDLDIMISKMNEHSDINFYFYEFLHENFENPKIYEIEKCREYEIKVYDILDNLLYHDDEALIYNDETDEEYGKYEYHREATKKAFIEKLEYNFTKEDLNKDLIDFYPKITLLEYAMNLLDYFFENGEDLGDSPIIDNDIEFELEFQRNLEFLMDDCQNNKDPRKLYCEIVDLIAPYDWDKHDFDVTIGEKIEKDFIRNNLKVFDLDKNGLLCIEREIKLKDLLQKPDELNKSLYHSSNFHYPDGIGNCWTYHSGAAESYAGFDGNAIILKGKINCESIDWEATIGLNLNFSDEWEVRLKPNSQVEIDEIILKDNNKHLPLQEPIIVSSGNKWENNY